MPIIDYCRNLKVISFANTSLSDATIAYICKNINARIEEFNFHGVDFRDRDIADLIPRCKNLQALDIGCNSYVSSVSLNLIARQSNISKLALPTHLTYNQVSVLKESQTLKSLWYPLVWHATNNAFEIHQEKLKKMFNHVIINKGRLQIPTDYSFICDQEKMS